MHDGFIMKIMVMAWRYFQNLYIVLLNDLMKNPKLIIPINVLNFWGIQAQCSNRVLNFFGFSTSCSYKICSYKKK